MCKHINIWTVCGTVMVCICITCLFLCIYAADSCEEFECFMTKSSNGNACKTIIKEENGKETKLSYDGKQYMAKRSDGTVGSGKFLLTLTGRLPQSKSCNVIGHMLQN